MTSKNLIDTFFDDFNKFPTVGRRNPFLDAFAHTVEGTYPPYNLIKTADGYLIEISVPGWEKEDLEVSFENRMLKVTGSKRELEEDTGAEYVYKGLSTKAFTRSWAVSDDLTVDNVFLENGLLCVDMVKTEPEKPHLLTIQ
jgi:molecular chaperone IbpA